MSRILKQNWLISQPFDYEMKQYALLGGLKAINEIIDKNMLYTAIIEVESVLHDLYNIKYNRDVIEDSMKILTGIDVDTMSLKYEYPIEDVESTKLYEICDAAIYEFESLYKEIRVKWRDLEKKCSLTEIPDSKPTFTDGYIMYTDNSAEEIIIYKYKEPISFSINWDTFKLIEFEKIPNSIREIAKFIEKDERNGNKNRYFRFSCRSSAEYEESIFPIMQYMLFNRIKHGI